MKEFEEFEKLNGGKMSVFESKNYNTLVFAYVGDAVFSLYVRTYFTVSTTAKSGILNTKTNGIVRATTQSKILDEIYPTLTEEEKRIATSARNEKTHNVPKNASLEDYKKATSFEAILGFLYLTGQLTRLNAILKASVK